MRFQQVPYADLNSRQKENFNFHKIAARLADYGFNSLRLTDDWQGADFIACHIDGETFLKVQLKARFVLDRKYRGKDIHIAFLDGDDLYLYPHDAVYDSFAASDVAGKRGQDHLWLTEGLRTWARLPKWAVILLAEYKV